LKNIFTTLKTPTHKLKKRLNHLSTQHGKESWLFLPKTLEGKVCLVAHIDTVWDSWCKEQPKKEIFFDSKKRVLWSPTGLGADNRAGVQSVLDAFYKIPEPYKPIVLLTDKEESGGDGAYEAIDLYGELLETNVSFFLN